MFFLFVCFVLFFSYHPVLYGAFLKSVSETNIQIHAQVKTLLDIDVDMVMIP